MDARHQSVPSGVAYARYKVKSCLTNAADIDEEIEDDKEALGKRTIGKDTCESEAALTSKDLDCSEQVRGARVIASEERNAARTKPT